MPPSYTTLGHMKSGKCRQRNDKITRIAIPQDAPFHFGKPRPAGHLAKMSACRRSGPPLRWRNRLRNLPVVARPAVILSGRYVRRAGQTTLNDPVAAFALPGQDLGGCAARISLPPAPPGVEPSQRPAPLTALTGATFAGRISSPSRIPQAVLRRPQPERLLQQERTRPGKPMSGIIRSLANSTAMLSWTCQRTVQLSHPIGPRDLVK